MSYAEHKDGPKEQFKPTRVLSRSTIKNIIEEAELDSVKIENQESFKLSARAVAIDNSILDGLRIISARLPHLFIRNSKIVNSNLSNCDLADASLHNALLRESKLTGAILNGAVIKNSTITDCQAQYSQWQEVKVVKTTFSQCNLEHSYFSSADLRGSKFTNCNLNHADFSQAILKGADIRDCTIEGVKLDVTKADGLIVSPSQALYLSRQLGLQIDF